MHSGDKTTKMKGNIIQDADEDRYWNEDFCQLLPCTYKLHFWEHLLLARVKEFSLESLPPFVQSCKMCTCDWANSQEKWSSVSWLFFKLKKGIWDSLAQVFISSYCVFFWVSLILKYLEGNVIVANEKKA